jgi:putative membrane protein
MPQEITETEKKSKITNRRVHMANERTFLSWIRTSIGIMAFGFVVEKFGIFIRQATCFFSRNDEFKKSMPQVSQGIGYSTIFGVSLIGLGALMGVLAFIRYKKVEKQINDDTYKPSIILDVLLAMSIFAVGIFLIIYLFHSF